MMRPYYICHSYNSILIHYPHFGAYPVGRTFVYRYVIVWSYHAVVYNGRNDKFILADRVKPAHGVLQDGLVQPACLLA